MKLRDIEAQAILIGFGSIGRIHLSQLEKRFQNIVVIDPKFEELENYDPLALVEFYKSIEGLRFKSPPQLAIIANWGPDHLNSLIALQEIGVKNFIVEKPLVDSFADLYHLRDLVRNNNLNVVVNHQNSYSYLPELISELSSRFNIGSPLHLSAFGGAKCIATIGIHYLSLASKIFKSRPVHTSSRLHSSPINPRAPHLAYIGGSAVWEFENQRFISLNFSNSSQVNNRLEILFHNALATIEEASIELHGIPLSRQPSRLKPTHTEYATQLLYSGNPFIFPSGENGLDRIYNMVAAKDPKLDAFDHGFGATEDLLATLLANDENQGISLPINLDPSHSKYFKKWHIS